MSKNHPPIRRLHSDPGALLAAAAVGVARIGYAAATRPYFLYQNESLSGADKPFTGLGEFQQLGADYVEVADFADTASYATPRVSQVRVLVRHEIARSLYLRPLGVQ